MKKEELQQYSSIEKELRIIEEKLKYLKEKKTSIKSMVISDMPKCTSNSNDAITDLLAEIEDVTILYTEKHLKLLKKLKEIEKELEKLENPLERIVLRMVYIERKNFEEIAKYISYSYRTVRRLHKDGVKKITEAEQWTAMDTQIGLP